MQPEQGRLGRKLQSERILDRQAQPTKNQNKKIARNSLGKRLLKTHIDIQSTHLYSRIYCVSLSPSTTNTSRPPSSEDETPRPSALDTTGPDSRMGSPIPAGPGSPASRPRPQAQRKEKQNTKEDDNKEISSETSIRQSNGRRILGHQNERRHV